MINRLRARLLNTGFWSTVTYLLGSVFLGIIGIDVVYTFIYEGTAERSPFEADFYYKVISSLNELSDIDLRALDDYGGSKIIESFNASFAHGEVLSIVYFKGQLGCVCQIKADNFRHQNAYLIWQCFTLPQLRGLGLYPRSLKGACNYLRDQNKFLGPIIVEISTFNESSIAGIRKESFGLVAKHIEFGKYKFIIREYRPDPSS